MVFGEVPELFRRVSAVLPEVSCLRWVRSSPGWALRREMLCVPYEAEAVRSDMGQWISFSLWPDKKEVFSIDFPCLFHRFPWFFEGIFGVSMPFYAVFSRPRSVSLEGLIEVTFQGAEWGNWLPPEPLELLRQRATLTASVATLHAPETRWAVCRKRGRQGPRGDRGLCQAPGGGLGPVLDRNLVICTWFFLQN